MDVRGARVLITGASRGIGAEMARAFASAGAQVALAARSYEAVAALADELGGTAHRLDLAEPASLDGFIERVEADGGPVDILVNNAGVESTGLIEQAAEDDIAGVVAVNLVGPQRLSRQVVGGMIERGRGHLVFTSSLAAITPSPGLGPYCATKAGLSRFAEVLRLELARTGVGVTVLHLGPIATDMWDRVTDAGPFDAAQRRLRRLGLLTTVSAERVAADTVRAVSKGRREVRHPKRLALTMALGAAPGRLTEALLAGFVPRDHR